MSVLLIRCICFSFLRWILHFVQDVFNQYNLPPGCKIANFSEIKNCSDDSLFVPEGVDEEIIFNHGNFTCQLCQEGSTVGVIKSRSLFEFVITVI